MEHRNDHFFHEVLPPQEMKSALVHFTARLSESSSQAQIEKHKTMDGNLLTLLSLVYEAKR